MDAKGPENLETALAGLPRGLEKLQALEWLRARLSPEDARTAFERYELRRKARHRLEAGERLFLTRKGLEQATDRRVAAVRAERFRACNDGGRVVDATAGIGSDLQALAGAGLGVLACETDLPTLDCLRANVSVWGAEAEIIPTKGEDVAKGAEWVFWDPDRRPGATGDPRGAERQGDPERWSPPWSRIAALLPTHRGACVKLAPATRWEDLDRTLPADLRRSWQWTSLGGELKELALWTGELAADARVEALALRGGGVHTLLGPPVLCPPLEEEAAQEVAWIAEPDPAPLCAGLLGNLAQAEGLAPLARELGYLGGARPSDSPFLTCYEVLGSVPLDRRRVRALLREHDVGPLTVKKRGISGTARELAERFRGPGKKKGVLLAARLETGRRAYLVRTAPPERG